MNNSRYHRSCYKMLYELDNVGKPNWATHVKETLFKYGLGYAWITQEDGNIHVFIHMFEISVPDRYQQEWHEQTSSSATLELYCKYKYLSTVQYFPHRNALTRFRCSNHKLAIETGMHGHVIRSDIICKYCSIVNDNHVIQNEILFLMCCPLYNEVRTAAFSSHRPRDDNFRFHTNICPLSEPVWLEKPAY
jgi:hypothetical protein